MTPAQERQAELDRVDHERRRLEALMLLALLGCYDYGRRLAVASIRAGHDPHPAIARAFIGNGTPQFPGVAAKLANGLAEVGLTARAVAVAGVPAEVAAGIGGGPNQPKPKGLRGSGTANGPPEPSDAPESQPEPSRVPASTRLGKAEIAKRYRPLADQTAEEMRENVGTLVNDILARASEVGASINAVVITIREAFAAKGWSAKNPARAKAQSVTLVSRAWSAGSFAGWRQPGVWQAVKGFEFIDANDERVCPICRPRHGLRLDRDHPHWLTNWPCLHYVCRCIVRPIWNPFIPTPLPVNLPPPAPGFGLIPSLGPGFSALGTL